MALETFPWPPLAGANLPPHWNGQSFTMAGQSSPILQYDSSSSHWSDDLTLSHEAEAGHGDHPIDRASREAALATVRRALPEGRGIVLDAGCSSGFLLHDLRAAFPAIDLIGADYIPGPLRRLATALPGLPLVQFDLRKCPFPDNSVNVVTCLNVLEHIDQDEQALHHIWRILKPGGVAHVEVPAAPSCYDIYDEYLMHHRRYTMRELAGKARRAGFTTVSRTHLGALVFPAFYFVKRRNRRLLGLPADQKKAKVHEMMRRTRRSALMEQAVRLELALGKWLSFPMGIRCVIVLRKDK